MYLFEKLGIFILKEFKMDNDTKEKISKTLRGHKVSEETKRKISEGVRKHYQNVKGTPKEEERKRKLSMIMEIKNYFFENYLKYFNVEEFYEVI